MAQVINVTSYSKLANAEVSATSTSPLVISVNRIIAIQTRATPYNTNGVTNITYALPTGNTTYQITLVVTEALAALVTACNAAS